MRAEVDVRIPSALRGRVDRQRLRRAALAALAFGGKECNIQLTIVLADDAQMTDLNRNFRGRDATTDVLAFESDDEMASLEGEGPRYLGDVIISHQQALEQAGDLGHDLQRELEILIVHGVLHLLGFDDETPQARDSMWKAQESVLAGLEAK